MLASSAYTDIENMMIFVAPTIDLLNDKFNTSF